MEDKYVFLKTTEHEGKIKALIADKTVLGDAGIASMRCAFNAHAAPRSRAGLLTLTAEQLQERLPELEAGGFTESVNAYKRGIECIHKRQGGPALVVKGISHGMN